MDQNNSDISTQKYGEFVVEKLVEPSLQEDVMQILGLEDFVSFAQIVNNLSYDLGMVLDEQNSLLSEVLLGNGSFATVYKATNLQSGTLCALKYFKQENQYNLRQIVTEFHIQYELNMLHKDKYLHFQLPINLIQTYPKHIWNIAAELELGECTLYQYLQSEHNILHDEYMGIFYQIFDSILLMHEHKYAHRDIKPQNIIYAKDKGWLLSDFGCALKYELIEDEYSIVGTKAFQYEEIRKLIKQLYGQQQQTTINLLKNDLFAFCLVMAMVKYPKKTVLECQQLIETQSIEEPELNQIMTLLDDKELLLKMQALIPLQYEKTHPNLDAIQKQEQKKEDSFQLKLLKCDALIKADILLNINEFQQLQNQADTVFHKQQIHMKYFIQGLIKEQIKPSQIIFPEKISNSEAETLHLYLSYVGQYTKLLEIVPRCKYIGNTDVRILEIYYYMQLNEYEKAFAVLNDLQSDATNFTMIDIAFYYSFKQILIFIIKGEFYQPQVYFLNYFDKLGGNALNLFKMIYFEFFQHKIIYGLQCDIQDLNFFLDNHSSQTLTNQIYYLKAKGYYQLQQFEEASAYILLLLQQLNHLQLPVNELLLELISQEVEPIVIERILHQIADSYFMLQKYTESCEYWQQLIDYCLENSKKNLLNYYHNYGLTLQQMGQYNKALSIFQSATQNQNLKIYDQSKIQIEMAITYLLMGSIEKSKQLIEVTSKLIYMQYISIYQFFQILKALSNYCYLLIQKQEVQFAKQVYEILVIGMLKNIQAIEFNSFISCTIFQLGSQIYHLQNDYRNFIDLQEKVLEIQTHQPKQLMKYQEIGNTLLYLAKANILVEPNETDDNKHKILNYYQEFIDLYINNDPLSPKLIEVYQELIDFCRENQNSKLQTYVESFVAYMIKHYGVENQISQEALELLQNI